MKEELLGFISRRQVEFQRGWMVVGQISALITFETFAMVFCTKFGITGDVALGIYTFVPLAAVFGVTFLGWEMIRSGYAHKYLQYDQNQNKDWKKAMEVIQRLNTYLDERENK